MRYGLVDDGYVMFALFFYLLLDRLNRLVLSSVQLVTAGPQTKTFCPYFTQLSFIKKIGPKMIN